MNPKVTIITVCYNMSNTIEETICSVINQTYKDIEYIIIDGNSNDGSKNIIDKYINKVSLFISEPDTGIYNAMNKGLKYATGDIVCFLNADDHLFYENVIELMAKSFNLEVDKVVYGNIITLEKETGKSELISFKKISNRFLFSYYVPHTSTFYKLSVLREYGFYDESLKIVADYELTLRLYIKNKIKFRYVDITTTIFSLGGTSQIQIEKHKFERKIVQDKYFSKYEIFIYKTTRKIYLHSINLIGRIFNE